MEEWISYLSQNEARHQSEFAQFLTIPSVSTLQEHKSDVLRAADWLASRMQSAGLEHVKICETDGYPVVYADWLHAEGAPTILLYGHYDVQPADPLALWQTPPFQPELRDGRLYARGASDMKGNVLLMVNACEAHLKTSGKLPVNIKFMIEGEEEIGSPSLPTWIRENQQKIACDFAASADSAQVSLQIPTVIVGTKGLCAIQVDLKTGKTDLHSGIAGGAVYNAIHVMSDIIHSMRDADGHIAVAGFYDDIVEPSAAHREMCARFPMSDEAFRESIGAAKLVHEPSYTATESMWFRPTLEVNGMWGGFQDEGVKTVIPCEAHAKISCRLVAGQRPADIIEKLQAHIASHTPEGVEVTTVPFAGSADPYLLEENHPVLQAADAALKDATGASAIHIRMGATVPVLGILKDNIGVDTVSLGFSGLNDGMHAPNESVDVAGYHLGARVYAYFFEHLGKSSLL
ncbi:dipeptidase [Alicyclobacillus curvatus]|nr:dipeptidase [Alicyclobacillus curvatus]